MNPLRGQILSLRVFRKAGIDKIPDLGPFIIGGDVDRFRRTSDRDDPSLVGDGDREVFLGKHDVLNRRFHYRNLIPALIDGVWWCPLSGDRGDAANKPTATNKASFFIRFSIKRDVSELFRDGIQFPPVTVVPSHKD